MSPIRKPDCQSGLRATMVELMIRLAIVFILAGCAVAWVGSPARAAEKCGPYEGQTLDKQSTEKIVSSHFQWLEKYPMSERDQYDADNDPLRANFLRSESK